MQEAAENAEAAKPVLDEKGETTDDEYANEEEGYTSEG